MIKISHFHRDPSDDCLKSNRRSHTPHRYLFYDVNFFTTWSFLTIGGKKKPTLRWGHEQNRRKCQGQRQGRRASKPHLQVFTDFPQQDQNKSIPNPDFCSEHTRAEGRFIYFIISYFKRQWDDLVKAFDHLQSCKRDADVSHLSQFTPRLLPPQTFQSKSFRRESLPPVLQP